MVCRVQRAPSLLVAAAFVAMVRVLSAGTTCVGDCDETYNYWEPLHYMLYGFGFQTWLVLYQLQFTLLAGNPSGTVLFQRSKAFLLNTFA